MYYKSSCTDTSRVVDLPRAQTSTVKPSSDSSIGQKYYQELNNVHDSEFIYLNCVYHNNLNTLEPVVFNASRTTPMLNERNNYKVGVVSVSGHLILPLLYAGFINMGLKWTTPGAVEGFTELLPVIPIVRPIAGFPHEIIYDAAQYADAFNEACVLLWAQAQLDYNAAGGNWGADPGVPLNPPGLIYNNSTQCFTLYADRNMVTPVNPPPANNFILFLGNGTAGELIGLNVDFNIDGQFLAGFPIMRNYSEVLFPAGFENSNFVTLNGNDYVQNIQDAPSVGLWNRTNSLVVICPSLGIRRSDLTLTNGTSVNSTDIRYDILDSFPISLDGGINHFATFANPNINFADINSHGPVDRISLSLYSLDVDGQPINPVFCSPGGTIIIRLVFSKTWFTSN